MQRGWLQALAASFQRGRRHGEISWGSTPFGPPGSARSHARRDRMRAAVAALALSAVIAAEAVRAQSAAPPVDFTIAFIGDQGLGSNAQAVLTLIRSEGADVVLHSGDFDYQDDPKAWDDQISGILGRDFPYFASAGNHDAARFYGPGGYQEFLAARMNRLGIAWRGDLGVQSSFTYRGIFFVLTTPDVFGDGDGLYDLFIARELAADDSTWRISSWHEDMQLMQVGGKDDQTGWGVYEQSRRGGAIIATAHEHSYSRTYLLSSCRDQTVASTASTLILSRDDPSTPADEGRSFVFVSGLGGKSIRSQLLDGPWWASVDTSTQGANYGALFGVFDYQGDPAVAHFYFKEIGGRVVDDFFVRSAAAGGPRPCTTAVCDCPEATPCDDGDACTVDDACDAGGVCRAGAPRSCEDFDACTVDTCSPRSGCDHRPIVLADVRRVLTRGSRVEACAGQRLPKSVARRLGRARRLLGRASRTGNGAGRAITRALHLLGQAEAALGSAQQHLSPGCAAALRGQLDDASTKMSCLRPGRRA